jgi:hypothetical protein
MADLSPIMTLFREFEVKYRQAGDMSFEEEKASGLLDECRGLEKQIMALPVSSAQDLAAKLVVNTRYGDYAPDGVGTGGLLDQALAILAVREHPDAKLIELGRQFDEIRAATVPLDEKRKAAYVAHEEAIAAAGIPDAFSDRTDEQAQLAKKIAHETGSAAAYDAFSKAHAKLIRLMKAIYRTKATTLEGFAVKAAAVAFDQSDFEVSDPVPTDVAERELYRLARDMAKVVKAKAGGARG